jgi:hypothetical protein
MQKKGACSSPISISETFCNGYKNLIQMTKNIRPDFFKVVLYFENENNLILKRLPIKSFSFPHFIGRSKETVPAFSYFSNKEKNVWNV